MTPKPTRKATTRTMSKLIRKPTRKPGARSRHPSWKNVFNQAILEQVIRPALAVAADVPLTSIGDYHARFQDRHQCAVSPGQFKAWLRDLNLIDYFRGPRAITPFGVTNRPLPPSPTPTAPPPSPMGGDDLVFDNEKPGFVPPELRGGTHSTPTPQLPVELEAALRGGTHPITEGRPRTVIPGFDLQMDDPSAGTLNLPGLTS